MGRWGVPMLSICQSLLALLSSIAHQYKQSQFISIGCGDGSLEAAIGAFMHTIVIGVDLAIEQITHLRAIRHIDYIPAANRYMPVNIPDTGVLLFVFPVLGFKLFCRYADLFKGIIILIGDDTCKPPPSSDLPQGWCIADRHQVLMSDGMGMCELLVLVRM